MLNVGVGIVWQTAIVALPIFVVIQDWTKCAIAGGVILTTSVFLKFSWYDNLSDYPADYAPPHIPQQSPKAKPS
jgi:hypothetical protein